MKSLDSKIPQNPSSKRVEREMKEFEHMLSFEKKLEARRSGLSIEEYEEREREILRSDSEDKKAELSPMENFIKKWEKEHLVLRDGENLEQISAKVPINPNSKFIPEMSREFISHLLYRARIEMLHNKTYRENHAVLRSFRDIRKIEIKHIGGVDKLSFGVFMDRGSNNQQLVMFVMDSKGEIILPRD